jgi:hypothetical protein
MTRAQARRVCVMLSLVTGDALEPQQILVLNEDWAPVPVITIRAILRQLEAEGLVEIDRTRRPMRARLVRHPDIPWNRELDRLPLEEGRGVRESRRAT